MPNSHNSKNISRDSENVKLAKKIIAGQRDLPKRHSMPNSHNSKNISRDSKNVKLAKKIIAGQDEDFDTMFDLAKRLKNEQAFGYARRILMRAGRKPEADLPKNRLKFAQQLALVTYKDPDLPPDKKFDDALKILRQADNLQTTKDQETLGLAGAIHKRRWELDGQKRHLERSLAFYLRGYEQGVEGDNGYTGINAAFVLDLIADLEEEEEEETGSATKSAEERRKKASEIREKIAGTLDEKAKSDQSLIQQWWFLATIAEAHFGLRRYDQALERLKEAAKLKETPEWERESTVRQLAQLARMRDKHGTAQTPRSEVSKEARDVLIEALSEMYPNNPHAAEPACDSAFTGKIGLALSGGGFRAALYHIGVLAKLAELDLLRKVEAISCVSGGSIIGAHYYLEVRKLIREKADWEITERDYIEIVKRIEEKFLAGVQTNIRTRVVANLFVNLKMIFSSDYSRTKRLGELYEENIFSLVEDDEGGKPRWLNNLIIEPKDWPKDGAEVFNPKKHNWLRAAKVPMLILNATTLNTGHNWQFTATWMGEPPSPIDSEVDGNYRLRRMYYKDAPEGCKQVRLGHAVAASSCVPGLFEPLALHGLYEEPKKEQDKKQNDKQDKKLVVRLVDGGVYDNQGTSSLLDQGCNILLVSDASGQMNTKNDPGAGLLAVPLRANTVLQARVRVAQYRELSAQRRASTLRGLMFIHLKKDLPVEPLDWIDCPDPQDPPGPQSYATNYGINRDAQDHLAAIRTDLDSFSESEARALMISGYRMTGREIEDSLKDSLPELYPSDAADGGWTFMKLDKPLTENDVPERLSRLLEVADSLWFKIWKLSLPLKACSIALAAVLVGALGRLCWKNWNAPIVSIGFGELGGSLWQLTWGAAALTVITIVAFSLLPASARNILGLVDYRKTPYKIIADAGISVIGFIAARLHLHFFDRWYLRWGKQERLLRDSE
jgi:predicted acylesterase/phospholipase RssA